MSFILSVYSINAFKEFLLPAIDNADSSITVSKSNFALPRDIVIPLEIIGGQWYIRRRNFYLAYTVSQKSYSGQPLQNGDLLTLTLPEGQILNIIAKEVKDSFIVYKKYDITDLDVIRIGQNEDSDIRYEILDLISGEHGVIRKNDAGYIVEDTSANGIFINSVRIAGSWKLSFGDRIDIFGLRMVFLENVLAINEGVEGLSLKKGVLTPFCPKENEKEEQENRKPHEKYAQNAESVFFHRAPRKICSLENDVIEIEAPPAAPERNRQSLGMLAGPTLAMALPMFLGCSLALYSTLAGTGSRGVFRRIGLAMAAGSAVIGMSWTLAYILRSRKENRDDDRRRSETYGRYLVKCDELIKAKYDKNKSALTEMYPSAEECCGYTEESAQLWGRNASHDDMLFARLGLGDIPFQVQIVVPEKKIAMSEDALVEKLKRIQDNYHMLRDVPVGVDLLKHRLIGVFGGEKKEGAIAVLHMIAAQIAANNCYTDVKMAFIYDAKNYDDSSVWNFAKWLPHVWSEDRRIRYVARDRQEAGDVFYELAKVFRSRQEAGGEGTEAGGKPPKPYYVLFVADPDMLEGELISKYIYKSRKEYGLTTVMFAENYEQLPNACEYLIQNDSVFTGIYHIGDDDRKKQTIRLDIIAGVTLETFARRLSNIRVSEVETGKEMPDDLTFFEMYGIGRPEELNVAQRWRKSRTYESMKTLIGQKAGGRECYLDVHEKCHGPHGLVAGTTGSGKSEILQTYILSLAINFSPEDVCFFIIDYKGGGMANLFSGLPHMVGQITNLSGSQVRRAMVSIKSENRRRQRIFNEYGVNNINLYTKLYKNGETAVPVPHLFIIIDEFAELKREEPDFMGELISVAQVGRSLGVHLILATQKPGGTVDDNIWSNSRFRICLRVQDRQDSMHMLHKPDAAYITQTGRCCLQVGNDELYESFQSGYSGAAYDEDEDCGRKDIAQMLSYTGRTALIGSRVRIMHKTEADRKKLSEMREKSQLEAVVELLADTARRENCECPLQFWLPILPDKLYLEELEGYHPTAYADGVWHAKESKGRLGVYMGLCDDPVNQAQVPLIVDPAAYGHIAVCGMAGSGKSTFLQTFMYSMICSHTPEEVNLYGIDFGSRMLEAFRQAPHVGGIILENESDRLGKFISMLARILEERKALLGGGSYGQYVKAHREALPAVLIVIDNYAGFRNKTEYKYDDLFTQLSKDGAGYGLFMVLTASGFGTMDIPVSMADNFRTVISLEMGDRFRYAEVHRAMHVDVMPEKNVKGRGLARVGEALLEFQTALSMPARNDYERSGAIETLALDMKKAWTGQRAERIPEIPKNFIWKEFIGTDAVRKMLADDRYLPMGYETEHVEVYGVDLNETYCCLLSGRQGTGKTNALKVLIGSAAAKGGRITVIDFSAKLRAWCDGMEIPCITQDDACYCYLKDELIPAFRERSDGNRQEKIYIFITDLAEFINHMYAPAGGVGEMGALIENLLDKGSRHGICWFGCLRQEDRNVVIGNRIYELFVRQKKGAHFGGRVSEQRIFDFNHVPYMEQTRAEKAGIAMLPYTEEETVRKVAVPLWRD
ncbi:MAG: type VII secretion protein EssC [Lachnospiraceae bacterium]|nr:type VII secretion protein EssC [Lachnospiraceae bacterium]